MKSQQAKATKIAPKRVRYIKLGVGGVWADECIREGTLRVGFGTEKHLDLCQASQWTKLVQAYEAEGLAKSTVTRFTGEVRAVYEDDGETLWITFHNLRLYWAHIDPSASAKVARDEDGTFRRTRAGWSCHTIDGKELFMVDLSGRLTKTASFRGTTCSVHDPDYVIRRINGERRPEAIEAEQLSESLQAVVVTLIQLLTPKDFELLVDLLFTSSGWRRLGVVGQTTKSVDLELELPSTGERAFVQIKSATSQAEFDAYEDEFAQSELQRMFYAFHTGAVTSDNQKVSLLGPQKLARMALEIGLVSWLTKRVG